MSTLKEWREELEKVNPEEQRMYPHAAMMDLLETGEAAVKEIEDKSKKEKTK